MPVHSTAAALAAAAALALGQAGGLAAPPQPLPQPLPLELTCVPLSDSNVIGQFTPEQLAQAEGLVDQLRTLLTETSTAAASDPRAAAVTAQLRSIGVTPAITTGVRQKAVDLADALLVADQDPKVIQIADKLSALGIFPTPADLRAPYLVNAATTTTPAPEAPAPTPIPIPTPSPTESPAPSPEPPPSPAPAPPPAPKVTPAPQPRPAPAPAPRPAPQPLLPIGDGSLITIGFSPAGGGQGVAVVRPIPGSRNLQVAASPLATVLARTAPPVTTPAVYTTDTNPVGGTPNAVPAINTAGPAHTITAAGQQLYVCSGPGTPAAGTTTPTTTRSPTPTPTSTPIPAPTTTEGPAPTTATTPSPTTTPAPSTGGGDETEQWIERAKEVLAEAEVLASEYADGDTEVKELLDSIRGVLADLPVPAPAPSGTRPRVLGDEVPGDDWEGAAEDLVEKLLAVPEDPLALDLVDRLGAIEGLDLGIDPTATPTSTATPTRTPKPAPTPTPTDTPAPTAEPTDTPEPTPTPSAAPTVDTSVWDRLAECESGGNWKINTGNGYYGGLQFTLQTWRAYGGQGMPHEASREQQIAIAEKVREARGGYGDWPACSTRLGLR